MIQIKPDQTKTRAQTFASFAVFVCGFIGLLNSNFTEAQQTRIAYVDMQRLIENAPQVAAARARLTEEFRQRDLQLKSAENKLSALDTKKKSTPANSAALKQITTEIDLLKRNITRMRDSMRSDLNSRSAEELNKRWPEIHDAVVRYAREQKIDLVVESPVVYASASIDITDEVLVRLRATANGARDP